MQIDYTWYGRNYAWQEKFHEKFATFPIRLRIFPKNG